MSGVWICVRRGRLVVRTTLGRLGCWIWIAELLIEDEAEEVETIKEREDVDDVDERHIGIVNPSEILMSLNLTLKYLLLFYMGVGALI